MSDTEAPFGQERARNPFASSGQEVATRPVASLGALASAEQQRALGELQAQIMLAKTYPRDPQQAVDNILRDCSRVTLAQAAQYEYARGGTDIRGPSIKLMEAIARRWGNISSGFKVVHTEGITSDVITYAWDLETGYRDERQFQVRHIRDTRKGPVPVTDERDVYELIANMSQRRKRACLQAVIPADVIDAAVEQCQETLTANVDTSIEGLKKMLKAFSEFSVTQAQIEQRIQCRLDAISPGQVTQLSRIYTSLKDGISVPSQWFRAVDPPRPGRTQAPPTQPVQQPPKAPDVPVQEKDWVIPENPPSDTGSDSHLQGGKVGIDEEDADAEFANTVLDEHGLPLDGEVQLDPLAWAQQFIDVWGQTTDHASLLYHNAAALSDARRMSPEADALLDAIDGPEPEPDALPASTLDPEDTIASNILVHLPTLATTADVIAYSSSAAVMTPINRWKAEGRAALVTSVRAAFQARLEALRGLHA